MKKSLLLYLFILALLFNVFTYMYFSKKSDFDKKESETSFKQLKDSLVLMTSKFNDANYFGYENNQNAQEYFENTGKFIPHNELSLYVTDKLKDFNDKPNGNPYVGFDKLGENKFIINKAKLMNHRWIICDFSDGDIWGEAIVKYFINEDQSVEFETAESVLYPK